MNIQEAKREVIHTVRAYTAKDGRGNYRIPPVRQRPVLLMGPPGIGKTAVVEQAAKACGVGLVSYTITHHTRQSAVGLPLIARRIYGGKEYAVTEYTISEIIASVYRCMETGGFREGILFIDEINCVSETLAPAMLQLLQGKTFGNHQVPEGWVIVAAGNPPQYNQSVREFDVVTLDRVKYLTVDVDYEAWKGYAVEKEIHGAIRAYLEHKPQNFYRMEQEHGKREFVTARGWEDLSVMLQSYEELEIPVEKSLTGQYLQSGEIAEDFYGFYRLYRSCQLRYGETLRKILEGEPENQLAGGLSMDEELAVANLLISGALDRAESWKKESALLRECAVQTDRLRRWNPEKPETTVMEHYLENRERALQVRLEAGVMSREEKEKEQAVNQWLRERYWETREQGIRQRKEIESYLETQLENAGKTVREQGKTAAACMDRVIGQLEAMGGGPALVTAMEAFAASESAMQLAREYECPEYQRQTDRMLTYNREQRLRKEIQALQRKDVDS